MSIESSLPHFCEYLKKYTKDKPLYTVHTYDDYPYAVDNDGYHLIAGDVFHWSDLIDYAYIHAFCKKKHLFIALYGECSLEFIKNATCDTMIASKNADTFISVIYVNPHSAIKYNHWLLLDAPSRLFKALTSFNGNAVIENIES